MENAGLTWYFLWEKSEFGSYIRHGDSRNWGCFLGLRSRTGLCLAFEVCGVGKLDFYNEILFVEFSFGF